MKQQSKNIFKRGRIYAGLTQQDASEKLNCSIRQLANYESGNCVPQADIVKSMARIYNLPWLALEYDRIFGASGDIIPEVAFSELATAVLKWKCENQSLLKVEQIIMKIASDGRIDDTEAIDWDNAMEYMKNVIKVSIELLCIKGAYKVGA